MGLDSLLQEAMCQDSRPILGYWAIRGLAQPIRLLLAYTGTEFEDKMYQCGPGPAYDRSAWMDVKFTLGLDFPNLPYYMETNVKLTGTNAILRHIARKHNLCGRTQEELVRVDMAAEQVMDMRNNAVFLFYNGAGTGFDSSIGEYKVKLQDTLKAISLFLCDRPWLAGDSLTFPDFHLYEMLDQHLLLDPNCLLSFPNLKNLHARFEKLTAVAAYQKSAKPLPCNNTSAVWGAKVPGAGFKTLSKGG